MTNKQMKDVFDNFFGDTLAKADVVIVEAKAKKKENKEVKINQVDLNKVYNNFFVDIMKRTEKF